jgi:hypothetical protein
MRSTTNLAWPTVPFGAGQRPFGKDRPMLAAVGMGWSGYVPRPTWGCAVYLTVESTRTLALDGHQLNFGYQVLTPEPGDETGVLAEQMDELLVACRRQAKFLAGHDFAVDLQRLSSVGVGGRLRGVDGVRQQWTNRADKGRGMAKMIDTAHDSDLPGPAALAALCEHADLKVATVANLDDAGPAATVRHALTCTLAVALVAARVTGRYRWASPIDVDEFVLDAAWDRLAELDESPPVS